MPELGTETGQYIFYPNVSQNDFSKISGSPIAYWVSEKVINSFNKYKNLGDYGNPVKGLDTCNNDRFVRQWTDLDNILTAKPVLLILDQVIPFWK